MDANVKKTIFLILAIISSIIIVQFILWLLPLILIIWLAYTIYKSLIKDKNRKQNWSMEKGKNNKIIIEYKENE